MLKNPRLAVGVVCLALLVPAGCTAPAPETVVSGVVSYAGEPAWEGHVIFLGPDNQVKTAVIAPDGEYRITNPPLGKVRVGVVNYERAPAQPPPPDGALLTLPPGRAVSSVPPRPSLRLPGRYAEPERSGVTVEVRRGSERIDIPLERGPGDPPPQRRADLPSVGVDVGQDAPDIVGEDLDGRPLRLSDHRGRVVAVLFYGHWCVLCRQRYEHDRALAARMKGRPFVLLGVNSDTDRDAARQKNAREKLAWRSWWDGGQALSGPVAAAWRVPGLPYLVLIDRGGVVRGRGLHGAELERAIEGLLEEGAPARR